MISPTVAVFEMSLDLTAHFKLTEYFPPEVSNINLVKMNPLNVAIEESYNLPNRLALIVVPEDVPV
jgi:hypothetical protein